MSPAFLPPLDQLSIRLSNESRRVEDLLDTIHDRETTIGQYRELVATIQQEMEDLRSEHDQQRHESAHISSKSQAVMNLNLKLQSSAVKAQARTIDAELGKLELAQSAEHLNIVQVRLLSVPVLLFTLADSFVSRLTVLPPTSIL